MAVGSGSLWGPSGAMGKASGQRSEVGGRADGPGRVSLGVTIFRRRRQAAWGRDGERVGWR